MSICQSIPVSSIKSYNNHRRAEELLRQREALLQAVATAVNALLSEPNIDDAVQQALERSVSPQDKIACTCLNTMSSQPLAKIS